MSNRKAFDEAIVNMSISISQYSKDYMFYLHLIAQCDVVFDNTLPAVAGVAFHNDHYKLYLNTSDVIAEGIDENGKKVTLLGFCLDMPLKQRIGILKHEMLHIIYNHVGRREERNHTNFNIAADCALNQDINSDHLPDYAIYPKNFPAKDKTKSVPLRKTSEFYYDLLEKSDEEDDEGGEGDGSGEEGNGNYSDGEGKSINPNNHDTWASSKGDEDIKKEITKKMVEKAAESTNKAAGNLPRDYSEMINALTTNREVNWKQVLRSIVGNKKVNSRKTLMRRDRRLPNFNWIKGKTKDRIFELGVISDVSGSVSSKALTTLWSSIIHICNTYKTPVTMVQVDTAPSEPEELTARSKAVERKSCGGTKLSPAIEMFKKSKINYDALVVTTDGFLFGDDIEPFSKLKVPVIWLIEKDGQVMPAMNSGRMRAIKLKE